MGWGLESFEIGKRVIGIMVGVVGIGIGGGEKNGGGKGLAG